MFVISHDKCGLRDFIKNSVSQQAKVEYCTYGGRHVLGKICMVFSEFRIMVVEAAKVGEKTELVLRLSKR
jgi:hypothetical protein